MKGRNHIEGILRVKGFLQNSGLSLIFILAIPCFSTDSNCPVSEDIGCTCTSRYTFRGTENKLICNKLLPNYTTLPSFEPSDITFKEVHIENASVPVLMDYTFYGLSIEILVLEGLHMQHVTNNSLRGLEESLTELYFNDNLLKNIGDDVLNNMYNLQHFCAINNQLVSIPINSMRRLPQLSQIYLFNNVLGLHMNDLSFSNISNLRDLQISNNSIETLSVSAFKGLDNLYQLCISHNSLSLLPPELFRDLEKIHTLDLSFNKLTVLEKSLFSSLFNMENLDLSHNKIRDLYPNIFRVNINLSKIDISYNNLSNLHTHIFKNLSGLSNLNLRNNILHHIDEATFMPLSNLRLIHFAENQLESSPMFLHNFPNLYALDLHGNRFTVLKDDAFSSLTSLEQLDLSYNDISSIEANALDGIVSIRDVILSHNRIRFLENGWFQSLINLQVN